MPYIVKQNGKFDYKYKEIFVDNANEITNIDLSSLCPGSVVYDIATGNVYILNSSFEWIKQ